MEILFQGDVLFYEVETIPRDATKQTPQGEVYIVAHSETGHHRTVSAEGQEFFETNDPLVCYLSVGEQPCEVVHNRSWDTHATIVLRSGYWIGKRQKEYTPQGWRRVQD